MLKECRIGIVILAPPLVFLILTGNLKQLKVKVHYYIVFNKNMKSQDINTLRNHKPAYRHNFTPKTTNPTEKTANCNQSLQQLRNIVVNNQRLQYQLAIYDWRSKTQFPIVKILNYKVVEKKQSSTTIEIKKQKYRFRLKNCKQLPLFKVLYMLKETIIGFQRLYDKFGPFLVTSSMIAINNSQKCRVWISQNYASNTFIHLKMNEATFLSYIYRVFQSKSNTLKNTGHFYGQLYTCKTFCEALNLIETFSKQNKIIISTSCKLTPRQLVEEEKKEEDFNFTASLSINNRSNYLPLTGLRISLDATSQSPFKKNRKTATGIFQPNQTDYFSWAMKQTNKKTVDTTEEISFVESISNHLEIVDRNKDFELQQNKETIYKSQLPINVNSPQKNKFSFRKCISNSKETKQLTRQHLKLEKNFIGNELNSKEKSQKTKNFGDINDQENEQMTKTKIQNTFLQNQWNKKLNGLLEEEGQFKYSIIHAPDKTKKAPVKLQLLGKFAKNVYQSFINGENSFSHQQEPQIREQKQN